MASGPPGRDNEHELGTLVIAAGAITFAGYCLVPVAVCALTVLGLIRLSGGRLGIAFGVTLIGAGWVAIGSPHELFATYFASAPVWQLSKEYADSGLWTLVRALLPIAMPAGGLAALAGWLVLTHAPDSGLARITHGGGTHAREQRSALRVRASRRAPNRWARRRVERAIAARDRFVLGFDVAGRVVSLTASQLTQHALIVGATGAGKTTTLTGIVLDAIAQGMPVISIDLKGDPAFARRLEQAVLQAGRRYSHFSLTPGERRDPWRPLAAGDPLTRTDKLMALTEWTEPHYEMIVGRFTQRVFGLLADVGEQPTVTRLLQILDDPEHVSLLADRLDDDDPQRADIDTYLKTIDGDSSMRSAVRGFASRIGRLTDPHGPLHGLETPGDTLELDIARALDAGDVIVFSLNSARGQQSAAQIASLALLDIANAAGERITAGLSSPALVTIDEFSALRGDHVLRLLARSRAAGIGVVLATQELADLARVNEHFTDQVIGNTAAKIIHRQDVPESAERLAALAGTRSTVRSTYRTHDDRGIFSLVPAETGDASNRVAEEFMIHPNAIKRLTVGRAVVIEKVPALAVRELHVSARWS